MNTIDLQPIDNTFESKLIPVKMVQLGVMSPGQSVEGVEVDDA